MRTKRMATTFATCVGKSASEWPRRAYAMDGVALRWSDLPLPLIERYKLSERIHERGGEREIRFLYRDPNPVLPVLHEGRLQIVRWGIRGGKRNRLPRGGWIKLASVEAGTWA